MFKRMDTIKFFCVLPLLAVSCIPALSQRRPGEGRPGLPHVTVHTVGQMNRSAESSLSHAGYTQWSRLEPIFTCDTLLPTSFCIPGDLPQEQSKAFAPCIRRLRDGKLIMFWQAGRQSSRIYYAHSFDGKNWGERKRLLGPEKVTVNGASTWRRFIGIDADILPSCEILAVSAYWNDRSVESGCGLVLRKSRDGIVWDKAVSIYDGPARNPHVVVLPEDGRVQCWFNSYMKNGSTAVMMVESRDKGLTWSEAVPVARKFKYWNDGAKVFTGQAPCTGLLADGRTLCTLVEECDEPGGPGTPGEYTVHGFFSSGFEPQALSGDSNGPAGMKKIIDGSSPYLSVFPSGEAVLSANAGGLLTMKIDGQELPQWTGNGRGTGWLRPFRKLGTWCSTSVLDSHRLAYVMDCADGIQYGTAYLNHVLDAVEMKAVIDGDGSEWLSDNALFIGSDSEVQTIFRVAQDGTDLYVLAEVSGASDGVNVELVLHNPASKKMKSGSTVSAVVDADGLVESGDGSKPREIAGLEAVCRRGKTLDGVPGFVAELRIPKDALGASDGYAFRACVFSGDVRDSFTDVVDNRPETWMRIKNKD